MRTDPHRYDHIHYRIASHARRLSHLGAYDKCAAGSAARGAAARLQPLPTRSSGHAALHLPSSQRHASPASPQPRWNRLVAAGGGPCACIPSWDVRDASLRCSTCWESTERSHGTQRCEGEKGMRGTRRSKERTGQGLWARPGAKLTGASRRSCWTKLSKRTCEPFVDRGRQKHLWRDPGSGLAEAYLREGAPMEEGGGVSGAFEACKVITYS